MLPSELRCTLRVTLIKIMKLDLDVKFAETFDPRSSVRQQLLNVQRHQMTRDFAERWSQKLRFISVPDEIDDRDQHALEGESPLYSSDESGTSSQVSLTGELKLIADENQGELRLPPQPIFSPKATCCCRKKRRFPKEGLSEVRITSKYPAELPGCNHYVAISYCWGEQEEADSLYSVQTDSGVRRNEAPSGVLSRAIAFAAYHGVRVISIDQECIVQTDREDKEEGINSMDLVYQQATHALALFNARITSEAQGEALVKSMQGQDFEPHEFEAAVEVFTNISEDKWLTRAWCFQESASAGDSMRVLIQCNVASVKDEGFMTIPGELELTIEQLKYAAAWVASWAESNFDILVSKFGTSSSDNLKDRADKAFSRLMEACPTSYQLAPRNPHFRFGCSASEALNLLGDRQNSRSRKHDRLAILANICNYSTRLNTESIRQSEEAPGGEQSFSICFAVLAILNGDMSLIISCKEKLEASEGLEESPDAALERSDIPTWLPAGSTDLKDLPIIVESPRNKFRLTEPVLCSEGLAISGHLWQVDQKVDLSSVQQNFATMYRQYRSEAGSAKEWTAPDKFYQDVIWCILRKLRTEGLMAVAESVWHCIRPPTKMGSRDEGIHGKCDVCADNRQLPDLDDHKDAIRSETSAFRLHLSDIIEFEDYPHLLCSPLSSASSTYTWISRRAIEDGFLWFGRKANIPEPTKSTEAEPNLERFCVVDSGGPMALLTPHNDLLEKHPRPFMAASPICWIVAETEKVSKHGDVLYGLDLVRSVWSTKQGSPMRYVIE